MEKFTLVDYILKLVNESKLDKSSAEYQEMIVVLKNIYNENIELHKENERLKARTPKIKTLTKQTKKTIL